MLSGIVDIVFKVDGWLMLGAPCCCQTSPRNGSISRPHDQASLFSDFQNFKLTHRLTQMDPLAKPEFATSSVWETERVKT